MAGCGDYRVLQNGCCKWHSTRDSPLNFDLTLVSLYSVGNRQKWVQSSELSHETYDIRDNHFANPVRTDSSLVCCLFIVCCLLFVVCCLCCADHRLLHFSWLGVVFKHIFGHDAKVVIKWGVKSCLDLELEGSPILDPENWSVSESWSLLHLEQAIAYIHVYSCFTISTQSQLLVAHWRHILYVITVH